MLSEQQIAEGDDDLYEWGCEYCRNDGKLNAMNCCPECDAQFDDEEPKP